MNAILQSTATGAVLVISLLSAGCGGTHATRAVAVDDTQLYVDGTMSPTIASIDKSLQTLVILARGDEGPRKSGPIGDTVAGGTARLAPHNVSLAPAPSQSAPVKAPVKELARIERGDIANSCNESSPSNVCSTRSSNVSSNIPQARSSSGLLHTRSSVMNTDPQRRPPSPAVAQDGGANASRDEAAAQTARDSLKTRVRMHWEGTPASLISQVAKAIGFNVQTEGALGGLKVVIHEDDATVETVLRKAASQIDGKADIQVDTVRRTIWLVATSRR